jgi:hypothetical protein
VDIHEPRAREIVPTAATNAAGRQTVSLREVVAALEGLTRSPQHPSGWVATGVVADAIGVTVGVAAARLRVAARRGLCTVRHSLREGTTWKPTVQSETPDPSKARSGALAGRGWRSRVQSDSERDA